ncbi:MAG: ABC transporter substrate-binding protein [Clostridia bacterium]|nr:ABC transporter substrate-binding protein [Clostridia bacterium]
MKLIKKLTAVFLVLSMLLTLGACSSQIESASPGTHTVVDHLGNEVEVPNEVNRVAVMDIYPLPSVIAMFFDSADKLVGIAPPSMLAAKSSILSELYPEILSAQTGYINGSSVNTEELMKLSPDVVFYSASQPDQGEQLRSAGFAAIAVSVNKWEYNAIETLNNWIALLEEVFSVSDKADAVKAYSDDIYDLVQSRVKDIPDSQREKVFFLFQYTENTMLTSGKQFFGQWWADAIGAKNVGEELATDNSVSVNLEQVYAWDPTLIFITNFTTAYPDDLFNNTIGSYDWSPVSAVESKNVHKMPLGIYRSYTAGADTPVTLLWLAKTAYPELFSDIDIIEETKNYYKEVFSIELTDDQASSIFAPSAQAGDFVLD